MGKLKEALSKVDKLEVVFDKVILTTAKWVVGRPWTARAVLLLVVLVSGYVIFKLVF